MNNFVGLSRKRKLNSQSNMPPKKRTKTLGFNILSEEYNTVTGLYTYRGYFLDESFKSFREESIISSKMRRETSGEVFILKGDISRHYVGTMSEVNVPAVPSTYHVHPSPKNIMNIDDLFNPPSYTDLNYYLNNFPRAQINFIFDTNGVFVVDVTKALITPEGQLKDRPENIIGKYKNIMEELKPVENSEGYLYFTGIDINNLMKRVEKETGGLKIQYIRYDENISDITVDINTINAL